MYRSQLVLWECFILHEMLRKATTVALLCWPLNHPDKPEVGLSIQKLITFNKIRLVACVIQCPLQSGSEAVKRRGFPCCDGNPALKQLRKI